MRALEVLDASAVRRWAELACASLGAAAAEIDALNVYPVPDRDTGTNLHLTMRAAVADLGGPDRPAALGSTLDRLARGAVLGARGNSGVIVSQLLRGLSASLGQAGAADGPALARALGHAADLAYKAVSEPVEGTILTVARQAALAADAVRTAGSSESVEGVPAGRTRLEDVARAAARGAALALERTPAQLAVLASAGVVDAGGRGLCVLLEAMVEVITGQPAPQSTTAGDASRQGTPESGEIGSGHAGVGGYTGFGYEVQFLLDRADENSIATLRTELAPLGDSLVVVDTGPGDEAHRLWNVHIHVDDVGAAMEAGLRAGRAHAITVTRFADDMSCPSPPAREQEPGSAGPPGPWAGRGLVALAAGAGLAGLFTGDGVQVVIIGPDGDPSEADVVAAIHRTGAAEVVVLPNEAGRTALADAAARQARARGQEVAVVPTKSPVQGLAAAAVADPGRRFADDIIAVAEAAAATRWAAIDLARSAAMTTVGPCATGAVLGMAEGDVVVIGDDQAQVTCELLDRLLAAGGELVTLVLGSEAVTGLVEDVRAHLRRSHREVELVDYRGDQPDQPVLIGVE